MLDVPLFYSGQVLPRGFFMPLLCARPLCVPQRMNHLPSLEKQQVKHKQMNPTILRKVSGGCRLRAEAAGVGSAC